jgi:hypothetical protein
LNNLFIIQLVTSFIAGGIFISLLSFIAERVSARTAGIVLTFPSTAALGLFFLGWAVSPGTVSEIVPATLIPLGLCILFPAIYTYTAVFIERKIKNRVRQIAISFLTGIILWLALVVPLTIYKFSDKMPELALGTAGYFGLAALSHFMLHRKTYDKPASLVYTRGQKIGRAVFIGFIIALVVFLGKTLGAFWGGVFAMFPAALSSYMMLIHWYYGTESLFPAARKIALGSVSIFVYVITAMLVFPGLGFIWGTIASYAAGIITTFILLKI